jgi:Asp-tRNA(Asn)/Glu-tRNA(Gln) amidotransferase A subunit family amidase
VADATLVTLTIAELAPKIKTKAISPVELTEAALAQADRLQPRLNSFITILHEQARRQAGEQEAALMRGEYRGPLMASPLASRTTLPRRASAALSVPRSWRTMSRQRTPT